MNFRELQTRIRRRLNEAGVTYFTDDDIKSSINEGYQELADATEFYEREAMIRMIKGHTYYNLIYNLEDTFLSPRRAQNVTTQQWLEPTTTLELDRHTYSSWETVRGEPQKHWLRGNWWYGVFPKPTSESVGMRLIYTAIPPQMEDDDEEPEQIPLEFHLGIAEYAESDLYAQMRETKKALAHWQRFETFVDRLKAYVEGRTQRATARPL